MATGPVLTIHRAADEIGGNCIWDEHLDGFENVQRLRDGEPFPIP